MNFLRKSTAPMLLVCAIYVWSLWKLDSIPRAEPSVEMEMVLPVIGQIALSAGDRYLAANLASFRSLVSPVERQRAVHYRMLAQLHRDIAFLNPSQQDSYYIASAVLPWQGELDAAQEVLQSAHNARPFDMWPAFYYGFDEMYFRQDYVAGAEWLRMAAQRAPELSDYFALEQIAGQWLARQNDHAVAIRIVKSMIAESRDPSFKGYLQKRLLRLQNLQSLSAAIKRFKDMRDRMPANLDELISCHVINRIPIDPFGQDYVLDAAGRPVLKRKN